MFLHFTNRWPTRLKSQIILILLFYFIGPFSKVHLEGDAFLQDDARAPPYLQFTFYSIQVPPFMLEPMAEMVNLDPKVKSRNNH